MVGPILPPELTADEGRAGSSLELDVTDVSLSNLCPFEESLAIAANQIVEPSSPQHSSAVVRLRHSHSLQS